jgi:hypothetical protein
VGEVGVVASCWVGSARASWCREVTPSLVNTLRKVDNDGPRRDRGRGQNIARHPATLIFGAQTWRLLTFLTDLQNLSPAEIDLVTSAWKQVSRLDRAQA